MLIILREEFDTVPFGYMENIIYNRIKREFIRVIGNEIAAERILSKYWHYTLRELSCNSMVNIMECFIIL